MSDQKVVLVTGASSGIGSATAELLVSRGYRVFGTARSPHKAGAIPGVTLLPLDVTLAASVTHAVQAVLDTAGRIDVLVNNAGLGVFGAFEETSIEQAQALFDTNVFGVIRTSKAVLPHMRARRSGLIVNVSSVQGFIPAPYAAIYSSTKHALEGLSESLDHEVRQFGIRVVLVEPAFTRTGFDTNSVTAATPLDAYDKERAQVAAALVANFRAAPEPFGVAEEIARAIESPYRLRRPVGSQAKLVGRLRRFMPARTVDRQLRKVFALE
ncbi:MAG TPA: oxidoreductase [Steroidobacteraceae bacterium]|jgi:short-subunit dehydrogenase|nr:oxidoreductase [Steroidobacteraceae bacterium]